MCRILVFSVIAFALAPQCAIAQTATESVPPPPVPEVVEELPADRSDTRQSDTKQIDAKESDDPLARIERRLEQIEKRLERSEPAPVVVEQEPPSLPEPTTAAPILPEVAGENSRYVNYNGVWWYRLPSNRWVYWSNGAWVDFAPTTQPPPPAYESPTYSYLPSYGSYSYVPSFSNYYGYSSYPRYYTSYGSYPGYGGYYGSGYYGSGWGSSIGLGFSIADALSNNRYYHRHYGHRHGRYRHGDDDDDDD